MNTNPYESPQSVELGNGPSANFASHEATNMKGEELFGVVVRTLGLLSFFWGVLFIWGLVFPTPGRRWTDYVGSVVFFTVFGLISFFFADTIVALAYRQKNF